MRCRTARHMISQRIDGGLGPGPEARLDAHLDGCAECRELLSDMQAIADTARGLEKVEPSAQVWKRIESSLRVPLNRRPLLQQRTHPPRSPFMAPPLLRWAAATAFVLVFAAGIFYVGLRFGRSGRIPGAGLPGYAVQKLEEAEIHYQRAVQALNEVLEAEENGFDPQILAVFRENLEIINASIQECKHAVRQFPDDFEARHFLLAAYKEKTDLLEEMITFQNKWARGAGNQTKI